MEIRYAERHELREAAAFINDCWRWAYEDILDPVYLDTLSDGACHERMLERYDDGGRPLLLFSDDMELMGYCRFGSSNTEVYPGDGEISAIYLREDIVGRGYGHALFTLAQDELRAQGYRNLVLDVLSENTRAIAFYRAHGFRKVGGQKYSWGGKEYPLDIMRKTAEDDYD